MKNELIFVEGLSAVNSAESTFGNIVAFGNKIVIPFFNVKIDLNSKIGLQEKSNNYVEFCYLIFCNTQAITWDYDISRHLVDEKRDCYGGLFFSSKKYSEFWVQYDKGYIVFNNEVSISTNPFIMKDNFNKFNFHDSLLMTEIVSCIDKKGE